MNTDNATEVQEQQPRDFSPKRMRWVVDADMKHCLNVDDIAYVSLESGYEEGFPAEMFYVIAHLRSSEKEFVLTRHSDEQSAVSTLRYWETAQNGEA